MKCLPGGGLGGESRPSLGDTSSSLLASFTSRRSIHHRDLARCSPLTRSLTRSLSPSLTHTPFCRFLFKPAVSQPVNSGLGVLLMSGAQRELARLRPTYQDGDGIPLEGRSGGSGSRGKLLVARTPSPTPGPGSDCRFPSRPVLLLLMYRCSTDTVLI